MARAGWIVRVQVVKFKKVYQMVAGKTLLQQPLNRIADLTMDKLLMMPVLVANRLSTHEIDSVSKKGMLFQTVNGSRAWLSKHQN